MTKLLATCAIAALGIGFTGSALAQTPMPNSTAQDTMSSPAQAMPALKSGETVYDQSGAKVGTIQSVKTDAAGTSLAVINVGKFLGLGSKNVLVPAETLTARAKGGYTTSLTSKDIDKLPEASGQSPASSEPR